MGLYPGDCGYRAPYGVHNNKCALQSPVYSKLKKSKGFTSIFALKFWLAVQSVCENHLCICVCFCVCVFVCLCVCRFVQQCGVSAGELRLGSRCENP